MRISGVTYIPRKTHKLRRLFKLLVMLLLITVVAVMGVSAYISWSLVHPQKSDLEAFSSNIVPDYTDVSFKSKDGTFNLSGWYFPVGDSDKTVILAHSYGANRLQFGEKTIDIVKLLLGNNFNVLAFDFRNCGKSGGNVSSMGVYEKDDLISAISYVKAKGSKHITLMGFSAGASASIMAAAESTDVEAVIADSSYADFRDYLNAGLSIWKLPDVPFDETIILTMKILNGIDFDRISPKKVMKYVAPRPVLLIHSKYDKDIPSSSSQELFQEYSRIDGSKIEYWATESNGHLSSFTSNPTQYMDKVLDFLDRVYTQ